MRRRLFTILSAVSLLLCAATCVLWVRSYGEAEWIEHNAVDGDPPMIWWQWGLHSTRQRIALRRSRTTVPPLDAADHATWRAFRTERPFPTGWHRYRGRYGLPDGRSFLGLTFATADEPHEVVWTSQPVRIEWQLVGAPPWLLAAALLVMPAWWAGARVASARRRARSLRLGRCPACGYDLRATPQAGGPLLSRCPECGAAPTGAT